MLTPSAKAWLTHRRDNVQPIDAGLAELLRPWLVDRPRDRRVFNMPTKQAQMLRCDLRRARVLWNRETPDRAERRIGRSGGGAGGGGGCELAVDPENQTIYWTGHVPTRGATVQRGRFDGTGVETIIDRLLHPKFIVIGPGPEGDGAVSSASSPPVQSTWRGCGSMRRTRGGSFISGNAP